MQEINHYPPELMIAEQRREEVALLLARGLVRLRAASVLKSANVGETRELALGFTGEQSVHTDTVNNPKTESQ